MGRDNAPDQANEDLAGYENSILGPDYDYSKQIKSPKQLGMSSRGSFPQIADNIGGLIAYVQLLVSGRTNASSTKAPLGTKFFLKTAVKCKDKATAELVDRYIYINNVPDGTIPFISEGLGGGGFDDFKGLVPGVISNVGQIHPLQILQSFTAGNNPPCTAITMETIDSNNIKGVKTHHVTDSDIKVMNPEWFYYGSKDGYLAQEMLVKETEAFTGIYPDQNQATVDYSKMPKDLLIKLYYSSLGLLALYIFLKTFLKKK
jgi:hypothetical protein